jgi:hypothetical protein
MYEQIIKQLVNLIGDRLGYDWEDLQDECNFDNYTIDTIKAIVEEEDL